LCTVAWLLLLLLLAPGQGAPAGDPRQQSLPQQPRFVGEVREIVVPVTVTDHAGNLLSGLPPNQFHLIDNGREQAIHVDVSYEPISMVVAVQANAGVESILPQVHKIPELLNQLIIGDAGRAAVLAFDHRLQLLQDFTNDPNKIDAAVKSIHAGSS